MTAFEALLIIWVGAGTNYVVMSTTRYESIPQCEAARTAVIADKWVDGWIGKDGIHCVSVPVVEAR